MLDYWTFRVVEIYETTIEMFKIESSKKLLLNESLFLVHLPMPWIRKVLSKKDLKLIWQNNFCKKNWSNKAVNDAWWKRSIASNHAILQQPLF